MKLKINIFFFVLFLLSFSCKNKVASTKEITEDTHEHTENTIELNKKQIKNAGISTGKIEMRNHRATIQASGILDAPPQNLVSVSSPLSGFLSNTELLQGMKVKKGQAIAIIKSEDYITLQQDYLETNSRLEFLLADYTRQQSLSLDNINTQKALQQAKTDYESAKAKKNGLKARLKIAGADIEQLEKTGIKENLIITSPINGYVTQVNSNLGAFINQGTEIFKIVDTEHLHAEIKVFEKDLAKIKINNIVYFTVAHETQQRKAHVYLLGREIEADRTVRIHCHLDKEDPQLLPGMYITAAVETQSEQVSTLPDASIILHEEKKYIFIYKEVKKENAEEVFVYEMVEIATGSSNLGYTEVILPKNININAAKVVISGAYSLLAKKFNNEEDGHGH